jgi:hypothetical protein
MTDFGVKDGAVSAMKGVAYGVDPSVRAYDLTHEIPPYSIWQGAYRLAQAAPYWPTGTVFVTVVDPGVGTDRNRHRDRKTKARPGFPHGRRAPRGRRVPHWPGRRAPPTVLRPGLDFLQLASIRHHPQVPQCTGAGPFLIVGAMAGGR